jgi:hypothetical protein
MFSKPAPAVDEVKRKSGAEKGSDRPKSDEKPMNIAAPAVDEVKLAERLGEETVEFIAEVKELVSLGLPISSATTIISSEAVEQYSPESVADSPQRAIPDISKWKGFIGKAYRETVRRPFADKPLTHYDYDGKLAS